MQRSDKDRPGMTGQLLRRTLDRLYLVTGVLGAVAIVLLCVLILVQVVTRLFLLPVAGLDEVAAWAVAGSAMLPLAYTFRHAAHIRVDLIISHVGRGAKRMMEIVSLVLAAAMVSFMAYAAIDMVWDSFEFGEMSSGQIVVPLWLPQIPLPVGVSVFAIALLDDLVTVLIGGAPSWEARHQRAVERAAEEI